MGTQATVGHTPGPWGVQNKGVVNERSARHEVVAGINVDGSRKLPTICKMANLSEESYANARLIAAAPDLLAALEGMNHMGGDERGGYCICPKQDGSAPDAEHSSACQRARAAIAKADATA